MSYCVYRLYKGLSFGRCEQLAQHGETVQKTRARNIPKIVDMIVHMNTSFGCT